MNFRVLKNRELAASIFLFVALGFGLYGGVFIFPLFTQSLLHFTPTETGLALMPGGLATAATRAHLRPAAQRRPAAGGSARPDRASASRSSSVAMWKLGHLTTEAGEPDVRVGADHPRRRARASCSRRSTTSPTPASKPSEAQQASGLINLARQLGGSFGIAILATYVTVHTQFHRVDLLTNVYAGQSGRWTSASGR